MYSIGDLIVYGSTGVCRVDDITKTRFADLPEQLYYRLNPLYQSGVIYSPVHGGKVFMRPVITGEEAERLIQMIPDVQADAFHSRSVQELSEHYLASMQSHDCGDLIELVMSIYAKKLYVEQQKRKFGQVDDHFMRRAEAMLHGEFAVALNMPIEEVPAYIASKVEGGFGAITS